MRLDPSVYSVITEARHLLDERTATGAPAPRPFRFADDERTRTAAIMLAAILIRDLEKISQSVVPLPVREGIMRRLFVYLARSRRQDEGSIGRFFSAARSALVLAAATEDIPRAFAARLRSCRSEPSTSHIPLPPDAPPRPVAWRSTCGVYRLEELIHPLHFYAEGGLGHCIGRTYTSDLPKDVGVGTPEAAPYLRYWRAFRDGRYHIYSFVSDTERLVTIGVAVDRRMIRHVCPRSVPPVDATARYVEPLTDAIQFLLARHEPITINAQLPTPMVRAVLDRLPPSAFLPLPSWPSGVNPRASMDVLAPDLHRTRSPGSLPTVARGPWPRRTKARRMAAHRRHE
jgi:hypothetical protein